MAKRAFDETLMRVFSRTPIEGASYEIVEYSYNGKPPRYKVVEKWEQRNSGETKENVILKGIEAKELEKVLAGLNAFLEGKAKPKTLRRQAGGR